jgi:hypothetical protein
LGINHIALGRITKVQGIRYWLNVLINEKINHSNIYNRLRLTWNDVEGLVYGENGTWSEVPLDTGCVGIKMALNPTRAERHASIFFLYLYQNLPVTLTLRILYYSFHIYSQQIPVKDPLFIYRVSSRHGFIIMRRVVVTGLGAITPLGVGVRRTWSRLLNSECGIVSVADLEPQTRWKELTSTVSGLVPSGEGEGQWRASDWLSAHEQRRMSKFTQYAVAASDMALKDSGWEPKGAEQQEATGVCLGSGIGNLDEIYETSLVHHKDVRFVCSTLRLFFAK